MDESPYEFILKGRKLAEALMGINRYLDPFILSNRLAESIKSAYYDLRRSESRATTVSEAIDFIADTLKTYSRALSIFPLVNNVAVSINALKDLVSENAAIEDGVSVEEIINRIIGTIKAEVEKSFRDTMKKCSSIIEAESGNMLMYGSSVFISECTGKADIRGRVHILESQPWEEGKIAKRILKKNPKVILHPDISLTYLARNVVDSVFIEVDAISINMAVAMTGSYQVLLISKEAGLDVTGVAYGFSLWHAGMRYDNDSIPRIGKIYEWGDSVYVPIYDVIPSIFLDRILIDSHLEPVNSRESIRIISKKANFARRLKDAIYKDEVLLKLLEAR